jgi:hypothetical protein
VWRTAWQCTEKPAVLADKRFNCGAGLGTRSSVAPSQVLKSSFSIHIPLHMYRKINFLYIYRLSCIEIDFFYAWLRRLMSYAPSLRASQQQVRFTRPRAGARLQPRCAGSQVVNCKNNNAALARCKLCAGLTARA